MIRRELKVNSYTLASVHNLRFIIRLTEQIREAIQTTLTEFKIGIPKNYYQK